MAVISGGQLVPTMGEIGAPLYHQWTANAGSIKLLTRAASYASIYGTQPWINTLVTKLAMGTARLPFKTYRREGELGREPAADSPLALLLARPNPRDDPFYFWLWTVSTFELYGEAMWLKGRPGRGRPPESLWPMHPANVEVRRDDNGELEYRHWLTDTTWGADDVVHFRSFNPSDPKRGLSRLEPLRNSLTSEEAIVRAQEAVWVNGARPNVVLEHPKDIGDGPVRRVKADWQALYSGVDNWGKTVILEEGMKAKVVQLSAAEMEMTDQRKLSREEACGVYDVPPPVVHILDHATFSNITEQMRSMYRDTQTPRLKLYESAINHQLRPDFDPVGRLYSEFLLDDVLRGDFEQRAASYQKGINSGWLKPSEVRQMENMPDAGPEADRLYVNATIVPMSSQPTTPKPNRASAAGAPPQALPAARTPLAPDAWAYVNRLVLGRLGRMKDGVDVEALVVGVPDVLADELAGAVHEALSFGTVPVKAAIVAVLEEYKP